MLSYLPIILMVVATTCSQRWQSRPAGCRATGKARTLLEFRSLPIHGLPCAPRQALDF